MGKFTEESKQLLDLIGGKSNIAAVSHCVTRMRFALNDPAKAVEYMAITRTPIEKISFWQKSFYNESAMFKSYLNDIGLRKLPPYEMHFDGLWSAADNKTKQKLKLPGQLFD